MSEPILLRAAPGASADLFHAVPIDILDPFLYAEVDDRRFCVNSVLERDRIEALGLGIEVLDPFELGMDELLNAGVGFLEAEIECDLRALRQIGMEHAIVPPDFPTWRQARRSHSSSASRKSTPALSNSSIPSSNGSMTSMPRPSPSIRSRSSTLLTAKRRSSSSR